MRSSVRSRPAPLPISAWNTPDSPHDADESSAHTLPTVPLGEPDPSYSTTGNGDNRPGPDPATKALQKAIDAYSAGATKVAERALEEAWRLCLDDVRATIAGRVREHDRRDDAEQGAFLKLWQAVRNWNPQRGRVDSAGALCKWFAHKAALNVVEKRDRIADREHAALDNDEVRDIVEYRHSQITNSGAAMDDAAALADFARYAKERGGGERRGQIWAAIILAVADGHEDREAIGQAVGIPAVSVRREIFHMVRALDLRALDHVEVIRDWRTLEQPEGDTAQSALFDFDLQEIS